MKETPVEGRMMRSKQPAHFPRQPQAPQPPVRKRRGRKVPGVNFRQPKREPQNKPMPCSRYRGSRLFNIGSAPLPRASVAMFARDGWQFTTRAPIPRPPPAYKKVINGSKKEGNGRREKRTKSAGKGGREQTNCSLLLQVAACHAMSHA